MKNERSEASERGGRNASKSHQRGIVKVHCLRKASVVSTCLRGGLSENSVHTFKMTKPRHSESPPKIVGINSG